MSVVVFIDSSEGKVAKSAAEAVTYARKVADKIGGDVTALAFGSVSADDLKAVGINGANKVVVARNIAKLDPQQATRFVTAQVEAAGASVAIFSFDPTGKAVAPRVATKLGAGIVSGAIDLPELDGGFIVKKNVFSGKAFAHVSITSDKKVISLLPNSIKAEKSGSDAEVVEDTNDYGTAGLTVKELKMDSGAGIPLPEAETVVSAGRGLKGPENWGMIEELAVELGAATACSRPVADIGWRPHHEHVGQTGVAIRPNLYFAIGISGAIQHLAGVNGSKVMVAINTDPEAPFFKAAHYGVVGDAFEVVPKLIEAVKKFKASQN